MPWKRQYNVAYHVLVIQSAPYLFPLIWALKINVVSLFTSLSAHKIYFFSIVSLSTFTTSLTICNFSSVWNTNWRCRCKLLYTDFSHKIACGSKNGIHMKSTVDSCNRLNKASLAQDHVIMTAVCYMFVKLHHMSKVFAKKSGRNYRLGSLAFIPLKNEGKR